MVATWEKVNEEWQHSGPFLLISPRTPQDPISSRVSSGTRHSHPSLKWGCTLQSQACHQRSARNTQGPEEMTWCPLLDLRLAAQVLVTDANVMCLGSGSWERLRRCVFIVRSGLHEELKPMVLASKLTVTCRLLYWLGKWTYGT